MLPIIQVALDQVGYLEKASDDQLENKFANAGYGNFTKFGAWYGLNGQPWCDMFLSWCADQVGEGTAMGRYAYVPAHRAFFQEQGRWHLRGDYRPVPGDVIVFHNESHIGLVEYVSDGYVHTIEGNTSGEAGLEANGGGVFQKRYPLDSGYILGYGHPDYENSKEEGFDLAKIYQNGSTPEPVFADTDLRNQVGSLNPWESCPCVGQVEGRWLVYYPVDGEARYKAGFVEYSGGL